MFIINQKSKKIIMTKGDTGTFNVGINTLDGKKRKLAQGETLTFTLRDSVDSSTALLTLTSDSNGTFYISPINTSLLTAGLKVYDVQFTTASNEIYTIIPTSFFELREQITR